MQVCNSLQTDNHTSTPPLKFFYRLDLTETYTQTHKQTDLTGICGTGTGDAYSSGLTSVKPDEYAKVK